MLRYTLAGVLLVFLFCPRVKGRSVADSLPPYIAPVRATNNLRLGSNARDYRLRFYTNSDKVLSFSNRGVNATVGGRLGKVDLTLNLPLARGGSLLGTEAKQLALNLQLYQRRGYLQLEAQRIRGFEEEDIINGEAVYRSDASITQIGVYGFRTLDERFSLRAAFRNVERQLRSRGSIILAATLQYQWLDTDGIELRLRDGSTLTVGNFRQQKAGLGAGYGYTWTDARGFYLTPVIVAGLELRRNIYISGEDLRRYRLSPRLRGRLALGYNGERYFVSVRGSVLPGFEAGTRLNARIRNTQLALVVGKRFFGR